MELTKYKLKNGDQLVLRKATLDDAEGMLDYIKEVCQESENLTFTVDEFNIGAEKQKEILSHSIESDNDLFLLGVIENKIISSLNFVGGKRSRIYHAGEFGMAVRKEKWNLGIGGLMIDSLLDWSKKNNIIRKINLRVRADNKSAVHLYKRKGFKGEGTISRGFFVDGEFVDLLAMGYEI